MAQLTIRVDDALANALVDTDDVKIRNAFLTAVLSGLVSVRASLSETRLPFELDDENEFVWKDDGQKEAGEDDLGEDDFSEDDLGGVEAAEAAEAAEAVEAAESGEDATGGVEAAESEGDSQEKE